MVDTNMLNHRVGSRVQKVIGQMAEGRSQ